MTKLQNLREELELQNLGLGGMIGGWAQDGAKGWVEGQKDKQVQNRVKQIEAMTKLQNLREELELQNLGGLGKAVGDAAIWGAKGIGGAVIGRETGKALKNNGFINLNEEPEL